MSTETTDAVCIIPNCNSRAGASEPFCAKHADVRTYTMRQIIEMERCVEVMHDALQQVHRYARSDGQRTFDDCIRDLERIDDICRGALK